MIALEPRGGATDRMIIEKDAVWFFGVGEFK